MAVHSTAHNRTDWRLRGFDPKPVRLGVRQMKWAGMYLVGFIVLIGGLMAALWKMGVLERIGTAWTLIGVAILIGIGIMVSVSHSGTKENIQIDRK
jgi:hypothetical protein